MLMLKLICALLVSLVALPLLAQSEQVRQCFAVHWARYALDLEYIDEATWRHWRDEYQMTSRMLQSLAGKA